MKPKEEVPLTLRQATRADADGLIRLILALAEYEKLPPPDRKSQDRLIEDGFGTRPRFETWLAFWSDEKQPVACAIFFETYSTFLAEPTLYLEDIFVLPDVRRQGVGRELFCACAAEALRRGCGRLEWQALAWNDLADGFYRRLGAQPIHEEWKFYRLLDADLERLVDERAEG